MRASFVAAVAAIVAIASNVTTIVAQSRPAGCLSLKGSKQCPSFQDAYINPQNLSRAWPWMSQVNDVDSFDQQFAQYWTDPFRFEKSKIHQGLQCNRTGSANLTLQWERTVYCGQFTQISYSAACNVGLEPLMLCRSTCEDYSASQRAVVANPRICTPTNLLTQEHNTTRAQTLLNDYQKCTDWNSLTSNNTSSCVKGMANEGNCGYGPGVSSQLCEACDPTGNKTVPACCTAQNTDLSTCASYGFPAAARIRPDTSSTSSVTPSATGGAPSSGSDEKSGPDLSGGQLAGVIVGCIVGALLLGALLALLLFGRKRRNQDPESRRGGVYGSAASGRASSGDKPWNSEDHMSRRSFAGSPEMDKAGAGPSNAISMAALGTGAAGLGAAGAGAGAAAASGASHHNEGRAASPTNRPTSAALTTSSGGEKGATVPAVRDQYTGQDIHVGEDVVAIYPYNASLNDELTLEPEQRVTILRLYDDGWALGRTSDGNEGAMPLVCVSSTKGDVPGRRGGNGTSTGTSDDEGMTSGAEYTSSVDGAVTAEEGGFTSDARSQRSRR